MKPLILFFLIALIIGANALASADRNCDTSRIPEGLYNYFTSSGERGAVVMLSKAYNRSNMLRMSVRQATQSSGLANMDYVLTLNKNDGDLLNPCKLEITDASGALYVPVLMKTKLLDDGFSSFASLGYIYSDGRKTATLSMTTRGSKNCGEVSTASSGSCPSVQQASLVKRRGPLAPL